MKKTKYLFGGMLAACLCNPVSAAFVINESDADTVGSDSAEFVELKGNPGESVSGLSLVFFDGDGAGVPVSTRAVDLGTTITADQNGYVVIGGVNVPGVDFFMPNGFIQNGRPNAVALYSAPAESFPTGSTPTATNLVDVLVYKGLSKNDRDWSGFGSPTVYDEGLNGSQDRLSLARVPDGTGSFVQAAPTPDSTNMETLYTVTAPSFLRVNQATAALPQSKNFIIRNVGATISVTDLQLAPGSSPLFSLGAPVPALPAPLAANQVVTLPVQFAGSPETSTQNFSGSIVYTTDDPTSPTGTIDFSVELVAGTAAPVGVVKVNEVCYNPGSVDHNRDGSTASQNDEYVELFNTTSQDILIEGWEQRCGDHTLAAFHSYVFPAGATIPANGFVTVFTSGNPTGFLPGTTFTYYIARINNGGSYVGISDGTKLIDGLAYLNASMDDPDADGYLNTPPGWTAPAAGGSFGRRPDGSDIIVTFPPTSETLPPTPNASNSGTTSDVNEWSLF